RAQVMGYLGYLGVTMNEDANTIRGEEVEISTEDSTTKVWVVPTDEEMAIARATEALVG
nr:acetate kinase [Lachnospiraceae bacterium]